MTFGDTASGIASTTGQVYDISADTYHADELGDRPSLSASIAKILCTQSPAHARAAHPRLNPDFERSEEGKFDLGTVAHQLLLEGVDRAHIIHADSWRTKEAKEDRDQARAHGRVPLLAKDWDRVSAMVRAAEEQLDALQLDPRPFTAGKPEQTLTWETQGVYCRALIDWLTDDHQHVFDYKSTSASAHPAAWAKTALGIGADVQVAFHSMGVEAVTGLRPSWTYVVQETYPPYALAVVKPDAEFVELGRAKIDHALELWRGCLERDEWPGYPTNVTPLTAPGWAVQQWLEREVAA